MFAGSRLLLPVSINFITITFSRWESFESKNSENEHAQLNIKYLQINKNISQYGADLYTNKNI